MGSRTLLVTTGTRDLEKNPPCNAEDNLRAGLIAIEAWFGGYCGSPGLGGPRGSRTISFGRTVGL